MLCLFLDVSAAYAQVSPAVFINELHYDDDGQDAGEAIEIAGPAGTNLSGWRLFLYNGSNQKFYDERLLQGMIPNQQNGFGTLVFDYSQSGIQNGRRDGIALVDGSHQLIQFLSYEGILEAADGPAARLSSTEIGVRENSRTSEGQSLQLSGTGQHYRDFSWQEAAANTFGQPNAGQSFGGETVTTNQPITASCPAQVDVSAGASGQAQLRAVDPDGVITVITTLGNVIRGVTLTDTQLGSEAVAVIVIAETTAEGIHPLTVVFKNSDNPVQMAICTVRINVTVEIIDRPDDYYEQARGLSGMQLKDALHTLIKTHENLSYGTIWDVVKDVDEDPANPQHVILLYTGRSQGKNKNSGVDNRNPNSWNREHVWSRSHGLGPRGPAGRFTDAHNLRAADASVNATRGSKDFDEGGVLDQEAAGNRSDRDSWEPRVAVRGDIARSMFYMAVRYEQNGSKPDLVLVNFAGTNGPKFGKLCTLLEWHEADAPDAWEKRRNDRIHSKWQGNRNPFVDHPEWAREIWGGQCP